MEPDSAGIKCDKVELIVYFIVIAMRQETQNMIIRTCDLILC